MDVQFPTSTLDFALQESFNFKFFCWGCTGRGSLRVTPVAPLSSGTYLAKGSSRESRPSSANSMTAAAVNCLVTEPGSRIDSGESRTSCSRSAMP